MNRKGKPFAAYLRLSHHTGEKSARTASPDGLLVVDYGANGQPLGVEITAPLAVPLERLNSLLAELGETPPPEQDYLPLRAAACRARRVRENPRASGVTRPGRFVADYSF